MMQQINLYRPIFRKQEKKFSSLAMIQAGVAILVGMMLIYGLMAWRLHSLRSQVAEAGKLLEDANTRLAQAKQQVGSGNSGKTAIEDQIAQLERQVAASQRTREVMVSGLFANTKGYSEYFEAFARQRIPAVWLTGFDIEGAGEKLMLQGRTSEPSEVPRYMQRLSKESVLNGKEFRMFVMSRPKKKETDPNAKSTDLAESPYIEFQFRTDLPKDSEKDSAGKS